MKALNSYFLKQFRANFPKKLVLVKIFTFNKLRSERARVIFRFYTTKQHSRAEQNRALMNSVLYIGFNRQAGEFTVGTTDGFYVFDKTSTKPVYAKSNVHPLTHSHTFSLTHYFALPRDSWPRSSDSGGNAHRAPVCVRPGKHSPRARPVGREEGLCRHQEQRRAAGHQRRRAHCGAQVQRHVRRGLDRVRAHKGVQPGDRG